jgi:hypothetical protein
VSKTAIVTIATGPRHGPMWRDHCRRNWETYAQAHGYDVICIDEPLDRSPRAESRSPTWQKCLVLGQPFAEQYEQIVWMDADMLINPAAPPVAACVPLDRIGAVDEFAMPTPELYREALRKLYRHWEATGMTFIRNETPHEFHAAYGLPARHDHVVQAGLLVMSPRHHRELLERVYEYEDRGRDFWGEWRPLSFELQEADAVHWIDPRFNYLWPIYKAQHAPFLLNHPAHPRARDYATAALRDVYCLHFAGSHHEITLARQDARPPSPTAEAQPARPIDSERLETPVALFVYARPDTTAGVLAAIREARPARLLVVGDAPTPELEEKCAEVRRLVEDVDWDCELSTNFAERHMGLNERVASGLDWVFDSVEEAIVLEDDCVPEPSFFRFCQEALARYRDDPRVSTVSGSSLDFAPPAADGPSYRASRYPLIWGWATWRRAWKQHDPRMGHWPELRVGGWLEGLFDDPHAVAYWTHHFDRTYRGDGSWDYAWVMTSWLAEALTLVPEVNLVANIGFRADATHTRDDDLSPFADMATSPLRFPLRHPHDLERDEEADRFVEDVVFSGNVHRMFERLRRARRAQRAMA